MFNIAEKGEWACPETRAFLCLIHTLSACMEEASQQLAIFSEDKTRGNGFPPQVESVVHSGVSFFLKIKEPQDASSVTSVNKIIKLTAAIIPNKS